MPRNILVADDDVDTRIILRTILERGGFAVLEAGSAEEAVELTTRSAFDLIILNYPLPDRDGVTLARRLRANPTTKQVPILNLTSRVVPQYLMQAKADGVDLSLPKPLDVDDIMRVVQRMTSRTPISAR